jgi:hypothetical protein
MKLIVSFRNFAKAPKSIDISLEAYSALNVTAQQCAPACFTQNITAHTNLQVLISRYRGRAALQKPSLMQDTVLHLLTN